MRQILPAKICPFELGGVSPVGATELEWSSSLEDVLTCKTHHTHIESTHTALCLPKSCILIGVSVLRAARNHKILAANSRRSDGVFWCEVHASCLLHNETSTSLFCSLQ